MILIIIAASAICVAILLLAGLYDLREALRPVKHRGKLPSLTIILRGNDAKAIASARAHLRRQDYPRATISKASTKRHARRDMVLRVDAAAVPNMLPLRTIARTLNQLPAHVCLQLAPTSIQPTIQGVIAYWQSALARLVQKVTWLLRLPLHIYTPQNYAQHHSAVQAQTAWLRIVPVMVWVLMVAALWSTESLLAAWTVTTLCLLIVIIVDDTAGWRGKLAALVYLPVMYFLLIANGLLASASMIRYNNHKNVQINHPEKA